MQGPGAAGHSPSEAGCASLPGMRHARVLVAASLVSLLLSVPAAGEPPLAEPSVEELAAHLGRLEAREGASEVAGQAMAHARRAIERARAQAGRGEARAAERSRQIAAAALLLAQRRGALAAERVAHREAHRRLERVRLRAEAAARALAHARAQRDLAKAAGHGANEPTPSEGAPGEGAEP
jgi:hypothetical protein